MKKIKNLLFPQKGKESPFIRLFIVLLYAALLVGIISTTVYFMKDMIFQRNALFPDNVQYQLSWALLDSSITPDTASRFIDARISSSKRDLSSFDDGYEYKKYLIKTEIPALASQTYQETGDLRKLENIKKVGDILDENIEKYFEGRRENFNLYSIIDDVLLTIIILILPLFIFFRAIIYRVILYIVFDKTKA